jgi:hypothetical protein
MYVKIKMNEAFCPRNLEGEKLARFHPHTSAQNYVFLLKFETVSIDEPSKATEK